MVVMSVRTGVRQPKHRDRTNQDCDENRDKHQAFFHDSSVRADVAVRDMICYLIFGPLETVVTSGIHQKEHFVTDNLKKIRVKH